MWSTFPVDKRKTKRGRPPRGEYPEKTAVMNFRIRPDTKRALQEAAERSGRTLSQETEHQLRRALFDIGTGPTHALFKLIGSSIDALVNLKDQNARWTDDPYLFDQAVKATVAALEMFRPKGPIPETPADALEFGGASRGQAEVSTRLLDIQLTDPPAALGKSSKYEREIALMRADLGSLADRPRIFGLSAGAQRTLNNLQRECAALHRKNARTAKEEARYRDLRQQIEEIQSSKGGNQ